ncbi:MAG: YdgA family protein, partial [Myxococcota bacterium]|nr:YdgA family protein [Myxococcota bacterium]
EISGAGKDSPIPGKIHGGHLQLDVRSAARRVVRLEAVFALDALEWGEESFGPGLVRVALRDVDLAAADSFRDALESLAAAGDSGGAPLEAEARLLGEWLPALVRTSPEFEVERFELTGWGGKLEGEGSLKVDGSDPGAFARESSAMEAIEARARLAMPVPLVDALLDGFLLETVQAEGAGLPREEILAMVAFLREMALARLRETGVLRREGERYDVVLRFEQGVLIVNGKLLGPGGLMGLLTGG